MFLDKIDHFMAEEVELLRFELQRCLARVENFLVRPPVAPDVSPPSELHVGFVDDEEASLYGCFSPRVRRCPTP